MYSQAGAFSGAMGDATPFNGRTVEDIAKELEAHGAQRYGDEVMYNPRSGEQVPCAIFMCPTYYQRLKHMVEDKVHCLTPDHDVLTDFGWKPIAEVTLDDRVATLGDDGVMSYERPLEVHDYPHYSGDMVRVRSRFVDTDVTANHRMYVADVKPKNAGFAMRSAGSLFGGGGGGGVRFKRDAVWDAIDYQLTIPAVASKFSYDEWAPPMDAWLAFFGIWMAEGCVVKPGVAAKRQASYKVLIAEQKQRVKDALYPALDAMGLRWNSSACGNLQVDNKQLHTFLSPLSVGAPKKRLPDWAWRLSAAQSTKLLDAMILGDGTWRGVSTSYYTSSIGLADDVMRLALHAGHSATKYLHIPGGARATMRDGRVITSENPVWRLSIIKRFNQPTVRTAHVESRHYDGPVHCLTVPGPGIFYVRKNGTPVWTGNSRGANGPVVLLTRQPAEGRARDGGLRLGEMELECLWAHGSMYFLKERFMECSDNYRVFVCTKCGMMATVNPERGIYFCKACKNITEFAEVRVPYASKLLLQEIETMSIGARFDTGRAVGM
jgi:hypothetical protein